MRRQIEKPDEQIMRFFTPELYMQFNSPNDEEADRANENWEKAIQKYQRHLRRIRRHLPSQIREVAKLCLHDAEVLSFRREIQHGFPFPENPFLVPFWQVGASFLLKQDQTIFSLSYVLWDRVQESPAVENWPFAKSRTHWLYDEVDMGSDYPGMYFHRILLSDGRILNIPFRDVITNSGSLPIDDQEKDSNPMINWVDPQSTQGKKRKIMFLEGE